MIKNGISEENLTKLFTHASLSPKDQDMVRNLSFLGINVIADVSINYNLKKKKKEYVIEESTLEDICTIF